MPSIGPPLDMSAVQEYTGRHEGVSYLACPVCTSRSLPRAIMLMWRSGTVVDVFLLRHSHVDYTSPEGMTPDSPLTPLGHQMAARLAKRCSTWDLQYLFVSTVVRAQQTADAISARVPELPRMDMSEFEEARLSDLEDYPGELPSEDQASWNGDHFRQGFAHMWGRVTAGWKKVRALVEEGALERVAILSHGGTMNILLQHFQGHDASALDRCWFRLDWTAASCISYVVQDGTLHKWVRWVNDTRHIDDLRHLLPD